jgi:citrate lyase subunit beta / citryl-CoA lyase
MSSRSRRRARRSCHIVSGSNNVLLDQAASLRADALIFDLEDGVRVADKAIARKNVSEILGNGDWDDVTVTVRVNAWDSEWTYQDVTELVPQVGDAIDAFVLAKVGRPEDVVALDLLLTQLERSVGLEIGQIGIEAQIESADGLVNIDHICASSARLESVVFGPSDFVTSLRMSSEQIRSGWDRALDPVLLRILVAARAHGLDAIDGPYFNRSDLAGLEGAATHIARLGFDGKWTVHADQIDVVNQAFLPSEEALDRARRVVDAFELAASDRQTGTAELDGRSLDEAARVFAWNVLRRGHAARLPPDEPNS